jgi:hypothetical protein
MTPATRNAYAGIIRQLAAAMSSVSPAVSNFDHE